MNIDPIIPGRGYQNLSHLTCYLVAGLLNLIKPIHHIRK